MRTRLADRDRRWGRTACRPRSGPSTTTLVAAVDVRRRRSARPTRDRPVADREVLGRRAGDAGRPVLLLGDHLRGRAQLRRRVLDRRHLALDGAQVVPGERRHASRSRRARRPTVVAPDRTMSRFVPIAANACSTVRLGALADRDHRDHRADADDDAERGQERAQLVAHAARAARRGASASGFMTRAPRACGALRRRPRQRLRGVLALRRRTGRGRPSCTITRAGVARRCPARG